MDKKTMVQLLQADLEKEYQAFNFYLQCSFTIRGYRRGYLKGWLKEQAEEELTHASALAEKISSLGGVPTSHIPEVTGLTNAVAILKKALEYETDVVTRFTQRAQQADELGDLQLKLLLEEQASESQGEAEELKKLLEEA